MKRLNISHQVILLCLICFLCTAFVHDTQAQLIRSVETRVKSKTKRLTNDVVTRTKGGLRMGVNSQKRALKSSLKGKRGGAYVDPDPVLDDLIEDNQVKAELSDNTNKTRYINLLGEWMVMPNDAEVALRAKYQAFRDSIDNLPKDHFRVTKKIADGSRDMILFGWHPHWLGNLYKSYNYNLLNVVSFYSYDINPENGASQNPAAIEAFLTGEFVKTAHDKGCSALLSISCHGEENSTRFLKQNPTAQRLAIDSILYLIDSTDADGVEINFNGVNQDTRNEFYKFVRILSNTVTAVKGDTGFVFMSVPPYDPENIYDISQLQDFVDIFIVKGYDFQETPEGLSQTAVAPYNYTSIAPEYDLRSAVEKYIANIGPFRSDRIVLSLPYYGTMWKTDGITDEVLDMSLLTYSDVQFEYTMQIKDDLKYPNAEMYYDSSITSYVFKYLDYYDGFSDTLGDVPHNVTIYYDDSISLRKKYRFIQDYRLGGVGIQSLGYDSGFDHLEQLLAEEFTVIETPKDELKQEINRKSSRARSYGIYFLAVIMYIAIFLAIGFCAALFKRDIRQALFDNGNFRIFYLLFVTLLMLLLGFYIGMFKTSTLPLFVGVLFGGLSSWLGWRIFTQKKSFRP